MRAFERDIDIKLFVPGGLKVEEDDEHTGLKTVSANLGAAARYLVAMAVGAGGETEIARSLFRAVIIDDLVHGEFKTRARGHFAHLTWLKWAARWPNFQTSAEDIEEALEDAEEARVFQHDHPGILRLQANCYFLAGDRTRAVKANDLLKPSDPILYQINRAVFLLADGNFSGAVKAYGKAAQTIRKSGVGWKSATEGAQEWLRTGLERGQTTFVLGIAIVADNGGDAQTARDAYAASLALNPDQRTMEHITQRLCVLGEPPPLTRSP